MKRKIIITVLYSGLFLFTFDRCAYNDINAFDCSTSDLNILATSTKNASSCQSIDGEITATGEGGFAPYDFKINDGEYQTSGTFVGLGPGTHVVRVKDMKNCWKQTSVTVVANGSDLRASADGEPDTDCLGGNGTLTITATGGDGPYQYQVDSGGFGTENSFSGLGEGLHRVVVKDSEECQTNLSVSVPRGPSGISFKDTIEPIMTLHCNTTGCHGAGTGARDWTNFDNVKAKASRIKVRTSDRTMPPVTPPPLSQLQINQIACWVDDGAPNN